MSIDGSRLSKLVAREPSGWQSFVSLAMRYGDIAAAIAGDLITRESEKRVIAVLLRCSGHREPAEGPPLRNVPLTQSELADATNLSRNSVGAILQDLVKRNLIALNRRQIEIRDDVALFGMLDDDDWRPSLIAGNG